MPPGGMIGGTPGIGTAQPGAGRPVTGRVNPVGGVIGGGTPLGKGSGADSLRAHPATSGMYGPPSSRGGSRSDSYQDTRWDPDNPWQTASGVDPVVMPTQGKPFDPGPAIGLS